MADSKGQSLIFTLLGLNQSGTRLYIAIAVLAVLGVGVWQIEVPRWRFSDQDEQLFRAARHGDVAGIEQSLAGGGGVNDVAPTDGKTALFRAAVFGHSDAVRALIEHGADPARHGNDGKTALDVVLEARAEEKDPAIARSLDTVATVLRQAEER